MQQSQSYRYLVHDLFLVPDSNGVALFHLLSLQTQLAVGMHRTRDWSERNMGSPELFARFEQRLFD